MYKEKRYGNPKLGRSEGVVSDLSLELLTKLQNLQDLLAQKTDLCLVLVNSQGEEITIPSRLPLTCNNPDQQSSCLREIKQLIKQARTRDEAVISKCFQDLYTFGLKTNIQLTHQEIYLLGGRTKDLSSIEDELDLVTAIFRLPITVDTAIKENNKPTPKKTITSKALSNLTPREIDVLRFLGMGYTNKMIASKLYISPNTVKAHVSQILGKLDVTSRTEAALIALNSNLVKRDQFVKKK